MVLTWAQRKVAPGKALPPASSICTAIEEWENFASQYRHTTVFCREISRKLHPFPSFFHQDFTLLEANKAASINLSP